MPEEAPDTTTETTAPVESEKESTDWKVEARKWEARAKENSLAAARLAEIEEATKTESQRLADRAEKAERELQDRAVESDRYAVALEKGLTASQAKRLVGSSREEFLADADQLLADLGRQSTPRADLSQGPKARAGEQSPAEQFADIIRAKRG